MARAHSTRAKQFAGRIGLSSGTESSNRGNEQQQTKGCLNDALSAFSMCNEELLLRILSLVGKGQHFFISLVCRRWALAYRLIDISCTSWRAVFSSANRLREAWATAGAERAYGCRLNIAGPIAKQQAFMLLKAHLKQPLSSVCGKTLIC